MGSGVLPGPLEAHSLAPMIAWCTQERVNRTSICSCTQSFCTHWYSLPTFAINRTPHHTCVCPDSQNNHYWQHHANAHCIFMSCNCLSLSRFFATCNTILCGNGGNLGPKQPSQTCGLAMDLAWQSERSSIHLRLRNPHLQPSHRHWEVLHATLFPNGTQPDTA